MKIALAVMALIFSQPAFSVCQTALANGNCNIVISGNNNTVSTATLRSCGGMDKEQAEKIIKLLNTILAKRDAAQINAKLDELIGIATKPAIGVNCPGNFGNCSDVNNGTQETNYGVPEPPPGIMNLAEVDAGSPNPPLHEGLLGKNPGIKITFNLSGFFNNPMFLITCDRPCSATLGVISPGMTSNAGIYDVVGQPNLTLIAIGASRVNLGQTVDITVRSKDEMAVQVLSVQPYVQPVTQGK